MAGHEGGAGSQTRGRWSVSEGATRGRDQFCGAEALTPHSAPTGVVPIVAAGHSQGCANVTTTWPWNIFIPQREPHGSPFCASLTSPLTYTRGPTPVAGAGGVRGLNSFPQGAPWGWVGAAPQKAGSCTGLSEAGATRGITAEQRLEVTTDRWLGKAGQAVECEPRDKMLTGARAKRRPRRSRAGQRDSPSEDSLAGDKLPGTLGGQDSGWKGGGGGLVCKGGRGVGGAHSWCSQEGPVLTAQPPGLQPDSSSQLQAPGLPPKGITHTDRHTHRQTHRLTHRLTDTQTYTHTD